MTEDDIEQQKRRVLAISDPLGLLRYGAVELQQLYERNLGMAFAISVVFHLTIISLFMLTTDDVSETRPSQLTEVRLTPLPVPVNHPQVQLDDEGSSGALRSNGPKGPAMRGDRRVSPEPFVQNRERTTLKEPVQPKEMKPAGSRPIPTHRETTTEPTTRPLDRDSLAKAQSSSGSVPGGAGGTGSYGTGGGGTGSMTDGLGTRGWAVRPKAVYPDGANSTGAVRLQFTVLPNGKITAIKPARIASQELLHAAMAGLRRARAKALPENVPQVPQQAWITFNFVLD